VIKGNDREENIIHIYFILGAKEGLQSVVITKKSQKTYSL